MARTRPTALSLLIPKTPVIQRIAKSLASGHPASPAISVCATAGGLALGQRLGAFAERYAAFLGGLILTLTGLAFAILKLLHVG